MPQCQQPIDVVSEIRVEPGRPGLRAVYLIETRSNQEATEIAELFAEIESRVQVRRLCEGKLVAYVVQAAECDESMLDEIDDVLRSAYAFVVTQRSFDPTIYRIVSELCQDTGSRLIELPHCNICGKAEPFPHTVVSLSDETGCELMSRAYCSSCTAKVSAPSHKEFIRSLLAADERGFAGIGEAELVRHPSHKKPIRFRLS